MRLRKRHILIGSALFVFIGLVVAAVLVISSPRQVATSYTRGVLERADLEKQTYEHDRGHITYFEGGQGPPVVFLHGLADQSGSWFRVAPRFDDHRVILVDLPRHGESPFRTNEEVLTEEVFDSLFAVLDERIGDEQATIVANSLGGWVAMEYALARPERIDLLILANSAGLDHDIDPTLLTPSNRQEARRTVESIFGDNAPWLPGFVLDRIIERSADSLAAKAVKQLDDVEFLDEQLPDLHTRVELIWGDRDLFFPLDYARRLDELLPDSELHVIEGCGHSPQVGCPDELVELIEQFLSP